MGGFILYLIGVPAGAAAGLVAFIVAVRHEDDNLRMSTREEAPFAVLAVVFGGAFSWLSVVLVAVVFGLWRFCLWALSRWAPEPENSRTRRRGRY